MDAPLILDQPLYTSEQNLLPFAVTDVLTEYAGSHTQPLLHFWQLENTMILGMKDTRVPYLNAGVQTLQQAGLEVVVRNSGGLGVIADAGVLNLSLILPLKGNKLATAAAYEKMLALTRTALPQLTITAGEVASSYCPGEYDLSVNGRKIAGIAQRRIKEGVAVMMYLSVNGDQGLRGRTARDFYRAGLKEDFGTGGYPPVEPKSMTTVADSLAAAISVEEVKKRFSRAFHNSVPSRSSSRWLAEHGDSDLYQRRINSMIQRNQLIKELTENDLL